MAAAGLSHATPTRNATGLKYRAGLLRVKVSRPCPEDRVGLRRTLLRGPQNLDRGLVAHDWLTGLYQLGAI